MKKSIYSKLGDWLYKKNSVYNNLDWGFKVAFLKEQIGIYYIITVGLLFLNLLLIAGGLN